KLCSGLVTASSGSVRVQGLANGETYQVAVIAIGADGTPSAPSTVDMGVPGPTFGIADVYKQEGGQAQGCAVAGRPRLTGAALARGRALGGLPLVARRRRARRRGLLALPFVLALCAPGAARAEDGAPADGAGAGEPVDIAALFGGGPQGPSPK